MWTILKMTWGFYVKNLSSHKNKEATNDILALVPSMNEHVVMHAQEKFWFQGSRLESQSIILATFISWSAWIQQIVPDPFHRLWKEPAARDVTLWAFGILILNNFFRLIDSWNNGWHLERKVCDLCHLESCWSSVVSTYQFLYLDHLLISQEAHAFWPSR